MAKLDDEIDRLYQLPLSEFTKARDALAKRLDKDKAAIRQLQKPNVAAWAVNQLYWRERGKYEALVAAGARLRAAQIASLKGKAPTSGPVGERHATTRRTAADRIRAILSDAGEAVSPATLKAINETLEALPTDDPPGRLVRPLKPMGFEGLAGMLQRGKITLRQADVVPFKKKPAPPSGKDDRAERRKEIQKLTASLREAKDAERAAAGALSSARKALEAAKVARERAVEALDQTTEQLGAATEALTERERVATLATRARQQIEGQLGFKKGSSSGS